MKGFSIHATPYYGPESNGMAESLVKTFTRDYLHMYPLQNAESVMEQLPRWFEDDNETLK